MSTQHAQYVLLFLVLVINSTCMVSNFTEFHALRPTYALLTENITIFNLYRQR